MSLSERTLIGRRDFLFEYLGSSSTIHDIAVIFVWNLYLVDCSRNDTQIAILEILLYCFYVAETISDEPQSINLIMTALRKPEVFINKVQSQRNALPPYMQSDWDALKSEYDKISVISRTAITEQVRKKMEFWRDFE
jgi:hypothetical protein